MKIIILRLLFFCYVFISVTNSNADDATTMLQHNPFNKPKILQAVRDVQERTDSTSAGSVVDSVSLPDLQAILLSDTLPMVMIDNVILSPGKNINGYKLLTVETNGAVFEKNNRHYHIQLKQIQSDQKELE